MELYVRGSENPFFSTFYKNSLSFKSCRIDVLQDPRNPLKQRAPGFFMLQDAEAFFLIKKIEINKDTTAMMVIPR